MGLATMFLAAPMARAQIDRATMPMRAVQVAPGAWFVQGESAMGSAANQNFISNAGFVVGDGGVLVVDALGSPPLARRLIEEIRKVTPLPIRYVVVSHYHADHIYGLQEFKAVGAKVVAHAAARQYIESDVAKLRLAASREELFPWVDERTQVIAPDLYIDGDTVLSIGRTRFRLQHVGPAHTPEDLLVHVPDLGVLFAGDLVFRGRIPYVGQADSRGWIASLDKLLGLRAKVLVPGHGPMSSSVGTELALARDYLVFLRQAMGEAARNLEPFDEAYARTDWSRFARLPLFGAVNRMNAYNTYLLMEQEASK